MKFSDYLIRRLRREFSRGIYLLRENDEQVTIYIGHIPIIMTVCFNFVNPENKEAMMTTIDQIDIHRTITYVELVAIIDNRLSLQVSRRL